jgi:hypothetical protein
MWVNILFFTFFGLSTWWDADHTNRFSTSPVVYSSETSDLVRLGDEDPSLGKAVSLALQGYDYFEKESQLTKTLIIVDFSKPSNEQRFYVFDLKNGSLMFQKHVAHGKNSGVLFAENFSNQHQSNSSSLGFFRTAETYTGKHGLSLRLDGLEQGINHNARMRAVVIHSADYANHHFIEKHGRLGRSFGCPTLPDEHYLEIIETIKEGSLLFIYHPNENYLKQSKVVE